MASREIRRFACLGETSSGVGIVSLGGHLKHAVRHGGARGTSLMNRAIMLRWGAGAVKLVCESLA